MILTKSIAFHAWQFNVRDKDAHKYLELLQTVTLLRIQENLPDIPIKILRVGVHSDMECSAYVETYPVNTPYGDIPTRVFTVNEGQWLIEDDSTLGTYKVIDNNELLLLVGK